MKTSTKKQNLAIYIRTSREDSGDRDRQLGRAKAQLIANGFVEAEIDETIVYIDAEGRADSPERPSYQALLRAANHGEVTMVGVSSIDRLGRG